MFNNFLIGVLMSTVLVVNAVAVPPSLGHNVIVEYEQDISQLTDGFDHLSDPFDTLTLLKDITSNELESSYYNAIDLEKANSSTIECITEQAIILKKAIETAKQELQKCLEEGAKKYAVAIQPVEEVKEKIQVQIEAGKEIVKNCLAENPGDIVASLKCIEEKGQPVREALIELAGELRDAIQKAEAAIAAIVEDTRQCLRAIAEEAKVIIQGIIAEIRECIQPTYSII